MGLSGRWEGVSEMDELLRADDLPILKALKANGGLRARMTAGALAEEARIDEHRIRPALRSLAERGLARRSTSTTWCLCARAKEMI